MPTGPRPVVRRATWLALLLLATSLLTSCSKDETASGTLVGPSIGPRVDESQLALDVIEGAPVGITPLFVRTDVVHLWVRWANLAPPHQGEAVWFNPVGTEVASALVTISAGPSDQVTDFRLDLTPTSTLGRWVVSLYLDGTFHRSHAFDVIDIP